MVDSIGPLRPEAVSGIQPTERAEAAKGPGPSFKDVLRKSIQEVNALQKEAEEAIQELAAGKREDFAGVITAVEKADIAFRTLMQVRNKLLEAYQEINRMRV